MFETHYRHLETPVTATLSNLYPSFTFNADRKLCSPHILHKSIVASSRPVSYSTFKADAFVDDGPKTKAFLTSVSNSCSIKPFSGRFNATPRRDCFPCYLTKTPCKYDGLNCITYPKVYPQDFWMRQLKAASSLDSFSCRKCPFIT